MRMQAARLVQPMPDGGSAVTYRMVAPGQPLAPGEELVGQQGEQERIEALVRALRPDAPKQDVKP